MRVAIYTRVSDRSQVDGYSLDDQLRACREYAAARGWIVVHVYTDEGRSAYRNVYRAQFEAMLDAARKGQFTAVVVYKFDRFDRKTLHQLQMAAELERFGVEICSTSEPIDRGTAAGKLSFSMMAAVAQFTSDTTGERVRDARKAAARQGYWIGPIPIGYTKGQDGILVPSADAEAVKLAVQLRVSGQHSYTTIAQALNAAGWRIPDVKAGTRKPFTKFAVEELLKNEVYIGKVHCRGQVFDGKHEPLIDADTWAKLCEIQTARAGKRGRPAGQVVRTPSASLFDLTYCVACGSRMWLQPPSGTRKHPYYLCSRRATGGPCQAGMVRADVVDGTLLAVMGQLAVPEAWHAEILRRATNLATPVAPPAATDHTAIQAELRQLRLDFADERLDEATYRLAKARLLARLAGQEAERGTPDLAGVAPLLWDLPKLLEVATPLERNAVYRGVFDRVWLEPHTIRAVTPTPIYEQLLLATRHVIRQHGPVPHPAHQSVLSTLRSRFRRSSRYSSRAFAFVARCGSNTTLVNKDCNTERR
jgi:DNA invertase Pin-like site-specific DNA recombinase